jgi:hypothetical protein
MRHTVRLLVLWHMKHLGKYSFEFSKQFFAAYRMAMIRSKSSLFYAQNRTLTFVLYRVSAIDREARQYTKLCFVKRCYVRVMQRHVTLCQLSLVLGKYSHLQTRGVRTATTGCRIYTPSLFIREIIYIWQWDAIAQSIRDFLRAGRSGDRIPVGG